jgi:protein phosphatase-4 regulatory subunit 3
MIQFTADHDVKNTYRQFLREQCVFHSVFELSPDTIQRIKLSYRLSYLKESVLAYYLYIEDPTYNFLCQVINTSNNLIIESILYSDSFIDFLMNFESKPVDSATFLNEFATIFRP